MERDRSLALVFPGQGGRWPVAGRRLYLGDDTFRHVVDRCDRLLGQRLSWSLGRELRSLDGPSSLPSEPRLVQPALSVLQLALVDVLREARLQPTGVVGLSMGEVAGLYAAGVYDLDTALEVVCATEATTSGSPGLGGMLLVALSQREMGALIREAGLEAHIAVDLSPTATVVAARHGPLDRLKALLTARPVRFREVQVVMPYHTPLMGFAREPFLAGLGHVRGGGSEIALYSSVSGEREPPERFDREYWWRVVSQRARFREAVESMLSAGFRTFLEVAPQPTLGPFIEEAARRRGTRVHVASVLEHGSESAPELRSRVKAFRPVP